MITNASNNGSYGISGSLYDHADSKFLNSPPGANDVVADPQFVDDSITLTSWASSIDPTLTTLDLWWEEAKKMNDDSGYNPDLHWMEFYAAARAGFTPTNTALQGAGYDGSDLGAVAVVPPNILVAPAAATMVAVAMNPVTTQGALMLAPSAAEITTVAGSPGVVVGSLLMTPAAAAILAAANDPLVIDTASITMTPAAASMLAAAIPPGVSASGLMLTATAATTAAVAGPLVELSNLALSPAPAGATAIVIDPTVLVGGDLTPGAAVLLLKNRRRLILLRADGRLH